jgi:tetratricopeptide (TPR) repeat protein
MDFPDWETPEDAARYSAVELFLQGARRARADLKLSADDLTYLTRICRLVGGMPLGILLAAAWVDTLTPAEIAVEIAQSLDILETELRDVPARQRSIRAMFDHSWRLLTEREREVFQGSSVFRGGFTREAGQQVSGASLRELKALVDKSLLSHTPMARYEVHELLRQYAEEKLDESPAAAEAARDRHCAYYSAALQKWGMDLKGARQGTALAEMWADRENTRTAWDWAVERGQVERLDQAVEGLWRYYRRRGRNQEGEAACRAAAEKLRATASGNGLRVLAKILTWQGRFTWMGGNETGARLLRQSLALLDSSELADQDTRAERAYTLLQMGSVAEDTGDEEEARRLHEQSLALYRALGDRWGTAMLVAALSTRASREGNYSEAKQLAEKSLALRRALSDQWGIANALITLTEPHWAQGHLEEAERLYQEAIAIHQENGHRGSELVIGLGGLGSILLLRGKYAEAHAQSQQALALCEDTGQKRQLGWIRADLGAAKLHQGQYEAARTQAQKSLTLAREVGVGSWFSIGSPLWLLGSVALAEEAYAEAWGSCQESVAVYLENPGIWERIGLSSALAVAAYAARGLGDLRQATAHLNEALRTAPKSGAFAPLMHALPALALLLADQGEVERAVELYALASRHPFLANSRWFEDVAGKHIAAIAATLPLEAVAAAQERGRARDLWDTAAQLVVESGG